MKTLRFELFSISVLKSCEPADVKRVKKGRVKIIVSRRVAAKAVLRNRIRRLIRESLVLNRFSTRGENVSITAYPSILNKGFMEIKTAVDQAIKKVFV